MPATAPYYPIYNINSLNGGQIWQPWPYPTTCPSLNTSTDNISQLSTIRICLPPSNLSPTCQSSLPVLMSTCHSTSTSSSTPGYTNVTGGGGWCFSSNPRNRGCTEAGSSGARADRGVPKLRQWARASSRADGQAVGGAGQQDRACRADTSSYSRESAKPYLSASFCSWLRIYAGSSLLIYYKQQSHFQTLFMLRPSYSTRIKFKACIDEPTQLTHLPQQTKPKTCTSPMQQIT